VGVALLLHALVEAMNRRYHDRPADARPKVLVARVRWASRCNGPSFARQSPDSRDYRGDWGRGSANAQRGRAASKAASSLWRGCPGS